MSLEDELNEAKSMKVDFSATSEDFENLPEGWYLTQIVKAGPGASKAGAPCLKVTYVVQDDEGYLGRYAFSTLNIDGKAAWKIRKALKAFGIAVEGKELELDPADLVGTEVYISVDAEGWVDDWRSV